MTPRSEAALNMLWAPIAEHCQRFENAQSLREILDCRNPVTLAALAAHGCESVKGAFAGTLRPDTLRLLDDWAAMVARQVEPGLPPWRALDHQDRSSGIGGLIAGATSQEMKVGAAVGSIFGPIGAAFGAAAGSMLAGARIDEAVRTTGEELDAWWDRWLGPPFEMAKGPLRAHLERDLDAPPQLVAGQTNASAGSGGLVLWVGAVLAIGLVAIGLWFRSRDSDSAPTSAAASVAASSKAAPSGNGASADAPSSIMGTWVSGAGDEIVAMSAGRAIALVMKKPAAGATYLADETVATLFPTSDASSFTAEVLVRPSLPVGMRLDAAAAARCQELWSEARGRPLAARLDGRRLVVDVVKLAVDPAALELAAGRVVGCRKFDDTKAARAVLTLTRR